jgi:hypothetical protein
LRYAILLEEGGIYIDHDVECIKALDPLQEEHDFFCGLEPLGPTILSSSVNPTPHLLAASQQHPILKSAKKWLIAEWDRLESQFPGADSAAIHNRVQHRAFRSLSMGIKEAPSRAGRKDVVFPPDYFSLAERKHALFAVHQHRGTWHKKAAHEELKVERLLGEVKNEFNRTFSLAIVLGCLNIALVSFLFYKFRGLKTKRGKE